MPPGVYRGGSAMAAGKQFSDSARRGAFRKMAVVFAALGACTLVPGGILGSSSAHGATRTALINGAMVIDSADQPGKSDEQIQAEAAGFTVTVVDGTTWASMTEAQFRA